MELSLNEAFRKSRVSEIKLCRMLFKNREFSHTPPVCNAPEEDPVVFDLRKK